MGGSKWLLIRQVSPKEPKIARVSGIIRKKNFAKTCWPVTSFPYVKLRSFLEKIVLISGRIQCKMRKRTACYLTNIGKKLKLDYQFLSQKKIVKEVSKRTQNFSLKNLSSVLTSLQKSEKSVNYLMRFWTFERKMTSKRSGKQILKTCVWFFKCWSSNRLHFIFAAFAQKSMFEKCNDSKSSSEKCTVEKDRNKKGNEEESRN